MKHNALFGQKRPSPTLKCRFDSSHALYKRESDSRPLFEIQYKGAFGVNLLRFVLSLAAACTAIGVTMALVRAKLSCCKK